MLDLTKLSPAPWMSFEEDLEQICEGEKLWKHGVWQEETWPIICVTPIVGDNSDGSQMVNVEFIALARNAFDVMMRRGWHVQKHLTQDGWYVWGWDFPHAIITAADPFTALVEADRWHRENRESQSAAERESRSAAER